MKLKIHRWQLLLLPAILALLSLFSGCGGGDNGNPAKTDNSSSAGSSTQPAGASVQLTLDWKPEPEFGGFYAAASDGAFANHGLNVQIKPAGEGADVWQLVATGKTEFGTTAADQVLIARSRGADVIAIFAVYQTFPQGIMVHKARGFTTLKDVFTHDGLLLAEDNSWLHFLENKFGTPTVKISTYTGGIAEFLARPDCSQQCFITSEPIMAKRQNSDPQTFLIADEGYNPYTTVVICKTDLWKTNPDRVRAMAAACRDGWRAYQDNPTATNAAMHDLNPDMDLATFADAAEAQKPLIETAETKANGLGSMTVQRWTDLSGQLVDLKVIDHPIPAGEAFVNP